MDIHTFIQQIPKAELHIHLEGTLEPHLIHKFALRNNLSLPPSLSALEQTGSTYSFHDLSSFLAVYYPALSVLQTSADFFDLTYTYLLKCKSQNIIHVELFFDPQAHTSRGVAFDTVITGINQALTKASDPTDLGISTSLIMCFLRDMTCESAMSTLEASIPYKHLIKGVGLDSDERGNPPLKFATVFERARRLGFLLTCHCDIDQENSIEHIRQCLVDIHVDRIDHGTNIIEDDGLVEIVRQRGLGLTCCPLSNSVVTADFKGKEIKALMEKEVKVTVNSDDPAYFRGYMNENLLLMHEKGEGMGFKDIVQLQKNAFQVSWIDEVKRNGFLDMLDRFVLDSGVVLT